jgi:uncharacterized membrane protein YphA (DoxX/SURF4 family)
MNSLLAFLGRVMFALIFILAGIQKFHTYDPITGGPHTLYITPKLDGFLSAVQGTMGVSIPIVQVRSLSRFGSLQLCIFWDIF